MTDINKLLDLQSETGEDIQKIIRNYKKDPVDRKLTAAYFEERLRRLQEAWDLFQKTDTEIREICKEPLELEYFSEGYYDKISSIAQSHLELFYKEANRPSTQNQSRSLGATTKTQPDTANHGTSDTTPSIINKLKFRLVALTRLLNGLTITEDQPKQYFELNIGTIKKLWNQIELLHDEVYEQLINPSDYGLHQDEYENIYDLVQTNLVSLSVEADRRQQNGAPMQNSEAGSVTNVSKSSLHLPKITIPQFNGEYLKWRQFYDLFSEMVDKQPIPAIQKMWYLKSNLSGEAERLISQLSLSETNYDTAWQMLQERYNNKRILVANLVQKIIDQPTVTSSASSIKILHDTTKECILALNNLGIATASWDAILIELLMRKLDKNTHVRYMQSLANPRNVPVIKEFLSFLELEFQSMESIRQKERSSPKAVSSVATSNNNQHGTCKLCKIGNHKLFHCQKFQQLSEAERLSWVQQQKLCVNCFRADHSAKTCTLGSCKICSKRHNTLLHLPKQKSQQQKSSQATNSAVSASNTAATSTTNAVAVTSAATNEAAGRQGFVLLATAKVVVTAPNGISGEFRAVLDSGSQVNIVSERLIRKLAISPTEASLCIEGVGKVQKRSSQRINVIMKSRDTSFVTNLEAYTLPNIIPAQPNQQIDISSWVIPNHIQLADPHFYKPEKVDILLGAEFFFSLTQGGTIKLSDDLPILQNTLLGWIVGGRIKQASFDSYTSTCAIFDKATSLEETIEQLWKLDNVESDEKCLSPAEKQCESHFVQHVHTNDDGRFIVSLPFRENPEALGESHAMAFNRFMSLEQRLLKNQDIRTQYIDFMQQYEQLGHMQRVDIDTVCGHKYFIPHHSVLKPDSSTTKLRVVFDASAKTSSGYSLNDIMYAGPTVQSELFSILLRFRQPRFVFTTDIEKMYRQILIHQEDQQYQLIIWRENQSLPIQYYKLNTVTYGTRAAPYLATRCLQKIADENAVSYPHGSQMLKHNFYVDDGLGGSDSLNEAIATQNELITILKGHGFNLKKWCANHPQLLKNIPLGDQEVNLDFNSNNDNTIKTLGLLWLPTTDQFCVKVKLNNLQSVSKRTATSDIAKLFDPLGLLAPVVVRAKIFIQQLWQHKLDWDEPLPEDLHRIWTRFRTDLDKLNNLRISRHIFKGELPATTQLHIFADASEKAFGAVAYIRAKLTNGRIIVNLLCAKTRVAPLKQQTLPRLELCAAVLAAQLAQRVKADLQVKNQPVFLWTDSEIVLSWINAQTSLYHTFVANRIAKIQSSTLPEQWRHIGSKDNPADILSRGLPAHKLAECNLWFYGPLFLHGREEMFPPKFSPQLKIHDDLEKRKIAATSTVAVASDEFIYTIPHRNSFKTLQRILGYVLRFIKNLRTAREQRSPYKALSPDELDNALLVTVRTIQNTEFASEIKQLQRHNEIDRRSSFISLAPFLDEKKILRVGGRLEASALSYDAKHQILLPYNDPLVKLLFTMLHIENKHCGSQTLLNIIKERFWPIKGKIMARSTVQKCVRCVRARPQLCQQFMGNLPHTRVTPARPFINAGVDYCGPFWIHYKIRGKKPTKAYIAVFCCFSTKATHLELVTDLSTEAFIGALKRFISRRGRCQNIYSDNATNFIGAKNQLSELTEAIYSDKGKEAIISTASSKGIHFHFIPPRAPHFGGLWEAAVKSAKYLLLRSVATASLTHEELETIIIEIEAILNSRPLTPMSNDPNNLEALTPGHFLIGEALTSQIDSSATSIKMSGLTHWRLISHLKQEFWKRWSTEYLNQLQQRYKWNKQVTNLKIGDMVIIKEDNLSVMKWPLARIVQIYPGDDGVVRVVEVKTSTGLFKRPIHRIALLPINEDSETSTDDNNQITKNCTPDSNDEPKSKRKKTITSHINLALFTIILLLPIVLGTPVHNKKFGTKLGIHFEQIGTAAISTTEWNILVYYDLSSYWSETSTLINGTKSLHKLCKMIQLNESCLSIIHHFEQMEGELQLENRLLRSKRGALNIVGNVAHSLFGILDSEYADQISDTIQQVKENESYLLRLLKNQTSIVDSTINVIRQNQIAAKTRFEQLEQKIKIYLDDMEHIDNMLIQVHLSQLFNSGFLELNLIANNVWKIQSSIIDSLIDTHHGKISPLLLTPEQLQNEVTEIKLHSPNSVTLPVTGKDELLQLFRLMKVQGRLTQRHAVFKITLPLVDREHFRILYLIPVPNAINNTMVAIKPCSTFLGINVSHKRYVPFTRSELNSCEIIKNNIFLCSNVQIRYNYGSEMCDCEITLYNNKTTPTCQFEKTTTKWMPLNRRNQWIYSTSQSSRATAVCNKEIINLSLKGSGLLTLDPGCVLNNEYMIMNGRQTISSTIESSYTSLGRISELSRHENITHLIDDNNQPNSINLDNMDVKNIEELTNLQKSLKQQNIMDLPNELKFHQQHNYTVSYLALSLSLVLLILLLIKYKANQYKLNPPMEVISENIELQPRGSDTTPTPMPRRFMLDV